MNIIEAVKSGKRFRRPSFAEGSWVSKDTNGNLSFHPDDDWGFKAFSQADILAEDWIVEDKELGLID